ncbi:MAG: tRNA uridine-5-carboxymethylaminomethyl(34) synthesis GTPase MnmE [Clostridia bacterium]|nr:tRNA uridine-5-carboxymethylaminomethyl(34) synthesis GTPase MnmE [Clostridia bacterium]
MMKTDSNFGGTATCLDTVAAVSTPFGKGGVALLRLSGGEAVEIADRAFSPLSGKPLSQTESRLAVYGSIISDGEVIDDGIAVVYRAPASFTGEDTVEISCHGGVLVTARVLEALISAGARQATAGEFTRRAFINGKMSLTKAEALGNLLDARNEEQLKLSRGGYSDKLTRDAESMYDGMCAVLSNIEAGIDFPEEDLTEMSREEIVSALDKIQHSVCCLLETYRTGHAIAEGIPTVVCGKPNVGKSALYNKLLGRDAAIVTDIAGTTRDVLSDTVTVGKVTLRLSDTAGIRDTDDIVESIGVERARAAIKDAELVLALLDGSRPADGDDEALVTQVAELDIPVLWVITKSDLGTNEKCSALTLLPSDAKPVFISSLTGEGIEELAERINLMYVDEDLRTGEDAIVFNARQSSALKRAAGGLREAVGLLESELPYDICAEGIRSAMSALAELCGREVREDVISEIFAKFCVGK